VTEFNKSEFKQWGNGSLEDLDELVVRKPCEEKFFELNEEERECIVSTAIDQHGSHNPEFEQMYEPAADVVSDRKDIFIFDTSEGIWQGHTADRDNDGNIEKVSVVSFESY
jgi:hypothetical protein